jgi:2,6-dihydroxypseudooxynicotine hydrolase
VEKAIDGGVHRFLADGVHYRDLMDIKAATPNWESWPKVWSQWAAETESRGEKALAGNAKATAAAEFARASVYYHYAQYLLYDNVPEKKRIHAQKIKAMARALPLLDPPMERVEIPFENAKMAAYFRLPKGVKNPPCVILLGGLDTTKEDFLTVNNLCIERGLATLAFDGPGQGETSFQMLWRKDFERSVSAVIDYLEMRPEIDKNRIGIIGRSMGGHYAPKAAALDKRIKAVVAWGAMYHLRNLAEMPEHTRDSLVYVSGTKSVAEALDFFKSINLKGIAEKITQPLLVVHGGLDILTPMDNAVSMIEDAKGSGKVETLMWDDSIHCCHDRSHIVRPAVADFMARNL